MLSIKHLIKHGLKAYLKNTLGLIKAEINASRRKSGYGAKPAVVPLGYQPVFVDEFNEKLSQDKWRYGMTWGDFHPDTLHQYYDNNGSLSYVSARGLTLELRKIPKTYKKADLPDWRTSKIMPEVFTIPVGVGMVSSKQAWQYGWFEAYVQLPEGQSYWPAFWLTGDNSWPPEIDIFEGYSHLGPKYNKPTIFGKQFESEHRKIQPNLHYGSVERGTKEQYRSYDVPVWNATGRYVQYVCHWERDFIKIYYDGTLIFETVDPEILKWYNTVTSSQHVVFNHGLHEHHTENPDESAMFIKSFKVYQNQDI